MSAKDDMTEETQDGIEMFRHASVPIQGKLDGFTPLIDTIAEGPGGIVRAAVFGKIWRYCQMQDGVCRAALKTIADGLGINRATVQRHAEALVQDGYLEDLTPGLKHRPHIYRDTRKAGLAVKISVAESSTDKKSVAQDHTSVAHDHLSKDLKKDKHTGEKKTRPSDSLFDSIAEVCKVDPKTSGSSIAKVKSALMKAEPPYTDVEVRKFSDLWWQWKDRSAPPTIWQLKERIGIVRATGRTTGDVVKPMTKNADGSMYV